MRENNYWVKRLASDRVSRRRFVGGAAVAGVGAASLGLVGCGDDDDDDQPSGGGGTTPTPAPAASPTPAVAQPKPGGVARFSSANATYDTFDASRSRFTPFASIIGYTMQRIVQWDSFAEGRIGGAFAEKWEQADAQNVVFTLRPNNFFHNKAPVNGRQTTAEDIKFHIERNKAGKTQDGKDDPNFYRKNDYQIVDKVEVVDATKVRVTLTKPSPFFMNLLAQSYEGIQAPEAVKQFEAQYAQFNANQIIGSGPYVLTEFNAEGRAKFKKFDKYSGKTNLDGLSFVPLFTDQAAQQAAFEQKQIDAFAPSTIPVLDDLRTRFKDKIIDRPGFSANPIAGTYYGGAAPWNNPNLIGAIFKAYDRRQLIQQFHGGRGAMAGTIPPTQSAFGIEEKELITFDGYLADRDKEFADAKKMWEAGGGPALGDIILDVPDIFEGVYQASAILTAMLNKNLGTNQFKAKVEPYSTITTKIVQQKYGNGNNNIWYGWITELTDPEPSAFLVGNFKSDSPLNKQYSVKVDNLDPILEKLAVELDQQKRQGLTKDAQRLLLKAYGAGIPYSHVQIVNTLWHNYFHPSEAAPFSTAHLTVNAWIDKDDPSYQGRPSDAGIV
jgi:peptide/nickel transport system substrate-binding protein